MDIVTSYDNWGGSGDRRSILSGNTVIFDGTETTYISYGNKEQITIDIIFSGLEGKLYIDGIKVIRSSYGFINKAILLNGISVGTFNDNVDHPLPMLTIKKNDKLTIRGQNNETGGGTYPTNIREIYFKTFFVPDKSLVYHEGEYKKFIPTIADNYGTDTFVPIMSSNESSFVKLSSNVNMYPSTQLYHAFDKNEGTHFHSENGITTGFLLMEFTEPVAIYRYHIRPQTSYPARAPKTWTLEGSNNGVDWTVVHQVADGGITSAVYYYFETTNRKKFRYYKLNVTQNNGQPYLTFSELGLYSYTAPIKCSWETISDTLPKPQQFLEKGMYLSPLLDRRVEKLEPIALTQRNDILDIGEHRKIFSETIDLKKYIDIRSIRVEVK
ncbi:discoidin domain-containing protein [Lysinibacillus fusiformis]|uniref:discoidin domain-containing protein n=1 Tax=Lysinibacillus fusiformis TaxID=28031 RepID=UPI00148C42E1|nr:discoidin domain-containing protein [Lysinibacillus fusiformis]NOG27208.1 hypothetical protein [Lysinibacillus fusiformis]